MVEGGARCFYSLLERSGSSGTGPHPQNRDLQEEWRRRSSCRLLPFSNNMLRSPHQLRKTIAHRARSEG